ncbi:MAG: glycosyltransferase [Planctomycetota bacterium]
MISILICTWKRAVPLKRALATLYELGWRPSDDLEIVTCHPPGNDESVTMLEECFPDVRIVHAPEANLSLQRNLVARASKGDVLVYLDDDAWPKEGWLDRLVAPFADDAVAAVGGSVVDPDGNLMNACMAATAFGRTYVLDRPEDLPAGHALTLQGNNIAIRRTALFALGGFDENYRYHLDETDVCFSLAQAGYRLVYQPDAVIFHEAATGPHRKSAWDRDWHTIAKNHVYYCFTHVRRGRWRLAFVPWMLQLPKLARFWLWMGMGRLSPRAAASCFGRHVAGTFTGYRKGLSRTPRRTLQRENSSASVATPSEAISPGTRQKT